ncbi:ATP-binding protein [Sphingomonas floccifaciens]|uniref:histidine kinase n=1 Tax=Sphingomonas floccifaciens TaxID=1844115 RepID=A0ABW4NIQ7_9SPHN
MAVLAGPGRVMEAPLLALTRRRDAPDDSAAAENMRQLVQLRWIAVAGQTATILFVHFALGVPLPVLQMLAVVGALALANLLATIALPRHRVRTIEIMIALLIDMLALTLQLYFSGGAANPFIALYLLQVVLGAILLPPPAAVVLVAATGASYALLTLRAVPLLLPSGLIADAADLFAIGHWIAFVMVAGLLVMFIARIRRNLSARDAHVADLRQHAAEQDGIVRMGLFASGAAHELGTPLGTLSVILADWRRMPAIADDPGLAADVAEMQGEVGRCKAIVSDILQSAGQPRGEAMERASARLFLDDCVRTWGRLHPDVPLVYRPRGLDDVSIAVDPALRQAIWNLLDNAAEVSPHAVELAATVEAPQLVVTVSDDGPGFSADVLEGVGKLYRSTKGQGHGLGLFLATNLARQLGGQLEARNSPHGGAEVRLLLPIAGGR